MRKRWVLSDILLSLLVICTLMYQSVHSFTHVLEEVVKPEKSHEKHHTSDAKHCYVCDFAYSPYITTPIFSYTFLFHFFSVDTYGLIINSIFQPAFSYLSLRGPPIF